MFARSRAGVRGRTDVRWAWPLYPRIMKVRRLNAPYVAVVLLFVLQVVLMYTVGGVRYEFFQVVGLVVLAVVLARLAKGSWDAWAFLVVLGAVSIGSAIFVAVVASPRTTDTGLIVWAATSGPLMFVLLSPRMLRHAGRSRSERNAPPTTSLVP
jgi:hypothetical protein